MYQHSYLEQGCQWSMETIERRSLFLVQCWQSTITLPTQRNKSVYACPTRGCHQGNIQLTQQKWLALPLEQRDLLKNYIVDMILQYAAVLNLERPMQNILSKCNSILIQIVKYEWNSTWRSFINDICSSSVKDMNIC